jgi:hypothetical protein
MSQGLTNTKGRQFALRLDSVGGGVTYIGEASPSSAEGDAVWRIKRMDETGPDLDIVWADGNASFDNVWTDRAGLSYS